MAPRKTAAAKATVDPTLKLHIEKGPASGQTNEFRPGSLIRIGRVVRGNTLSIKEDGISSKHLTIQLDDSQQHWIVIDLDSSNGTFLNSEPLTPHQPYVLTNNDEIKIGERTAIRVTVATVRKNTRGRGKNLGVIPEDKEGLGNQGVVVGNEVDVEIDKGSSVVEEKVTTRRTRNSKNVEVSEKVRRTRSSVKENEEFVELGVVEEKSKIKGGRGKMKVQVEKTVEEELNVGEELENATEGAETGKEKEELGVVEGKSKKKSGRGKKKVQVEKTVEEELNVGDELENATEGAEIGKEKEELGVVEVKGKKKGGRGKTKVQEEKTVVEEGAVIENATEGAEIGKEKEELGVVEVKGKKKGARGKTKVQEKKTVVEELNVIEGVETGKESKCGKADGSGVEKEETGSRKGQLLVDLESMTLGEWFDFLEDYLPKQIIDATEEVISDMKEKAKRLHEYKLQQMEGKK